MTITVRIRSVERVQPSNEVKIVGFSGEYEIYGQGKTTAQAKNHIINKIKGNEGRHVTVKIEDNPKRSTAL